MNRNDALLADWHTRALRLEEQVVSLQEAFQAKEQEFGPFFQQARFTGSRNWRLVYAAGLVVGAAVWWLGFADGAPQTTQVPAWQLLLGGVLVGCGARRSNGCTSGHGICGTAKRSPASWVTTATFMATAIAVDASGVYAAGHTEYGLPSAEPRRLQRRVRAAI